LLDYQSTQACIDAGVPPKYESGGPARRDLERGTLKRGFLTRIIVAAILVATFDAGTNSAVRIDLPVLGILVGTFELMNAAWNWGVYSSVKHLGVGYYLSRRENLIDSFRGKSTLARLQVFFKDSPSKLVRVCLWSLVAALFLLSSSQSISMLESLARKSYFGLILMIFASAAFWDVVSAAADFGTASRLANESEQRQK